MWMGEPGARLLEQQRQAEEVTMAVLLPFGPNLTAPPEGAAWGFNVRVLAWGEDACWSPTPQFHRFRHAGILLFP